MTTSKVAEASVNINTNSSSQDSTKLDDLHLQTCNDAPGFKPFTLCCNIIVHGYHKWAVM